MIERRVGVIVVAVAVLAAPVMLAQARRGATAGGPAGAMRAEPAKVNCPQVLGVGVQSARSFCDVIITRDPAEGIIVTLPPHTGAVTPARASLRKRRRA